MRFPFSGLLLLGLCVVSVRAEDDEMVNLSVIDTLGLLGKSAGMSGFSKFFELITLYPELQEKLVSTQGVTLFAPSNVAIANRGSINKSGMKDFLLYHVVDGVYNSPMQDGFKILDTDLKAGSSPYVDLPEGQSQKLAIYSKGTYKFGISYGDPVLATNNHPGIPCSNGVIYPLDTMLLPPVVFSVVADAYGLGAFAKAMEKVKLTPEYISKPGVTFFIPSGEVLKGMNMEEMPEDQLKAFLLAHIVTPNLYTPDLKEGDILKAADGKDLAVQIQDGLPLINGKRLTTSNALTSNGVIHVLDGALVEQPQNDENKDAAVETAAPEMPNSEAPKKEDPPMNANPVKQDSPSISGMSSAQQITSGTDAVVIPSRALWFAAGVSVVISFFI